jgi:hypothetical protein
MQSNVEVFWYNEIAQRRLAQEYLILNRHC